MNSHLFVYFTNSNLSVVASDNNDKEQARNIELSFESPFYLYPQKEYKSDLNKPSSLPDALLIFDGSGGNVKEQYHKFVIDQLKRLKKNYEKIYICYHNTGSINKENYHEFTGDFHHLEEGHHITNNPLFLTAISFISGNEEAKKKALSTFEFSIELKVAAKLWKELSLLKIKVTRNSLTEIMYQDAIKKIKSTISYDDRMLLAGFDDPKEINRNLNKFWEKHLKSKL